MAAKETQRTDGAGHLGWWLVAAFTLANVAVVAAVASATPDSSLVLPALVLLTGAAMLPTGTWTISREPSAAPSRRRGADGAGRVVAMILLLGSWAAAVGAAALAWVGTSAATALLLGWLAVLAATWVRLRRLPLLTAASLAIAFGLAIAASLTPGANGPILGLAPAQVLLTGFSSAAFMPAVMLGGLTMVVASLAHLAAALPRLGGAAPMRSLAASFAGLTGLALVGTVLTSSSDIAQGSGRAEVLPLSLGVMASLALLAAGAAIARSSALSRRGPVLLTVALLAVAIGGWFSLTAEGLALIAALVEVLLASVFALGAGLFAAAGLVRDGHLVRARFASTRRTPAAASSPATATAGAGGAAVAAPAMASPQHATG